MALNYIFPKWYFVDKMSAEHVNQFKETFDGIIEDPNYHQDISNHLGEFKKIDTTHHDIELMYPWNKTVIGSYVKNAANKIGVAENSNVDVISFRSYIGQYNTGNYRSNYKNTNAFSNLTVVYFHRLNAVDADKFKFFEDKPAENATGLNECFSDESIASEVVTPKIKKGTILIFPSTVSYLIQKCEKDNNLIFTAQVQIVPQFITSGEYFVRNENPVVILPDGTKAIL